MAAETGIFPLAIHEMSARDAESNASGTAPRSLLDKLSHSAAGATKGMLGLHSRTNGFGDYRWHEVKPALILLMGRKRETRSGVRRKASCDARSQRTLAASKTVLGDNLLRVFVDERESGALGREFEL